MSMASTSVVDTGARRHSAVVGGALGLHDASRVIGKTAARQRKPVVIYMVSPKIIHVEADEFMPLVQRLTGPEAPPGEQPPSSAKGTTEKTGAPARVEARALNCRHCPAPALSVAARRLSPPLELLFQDLSPSTVRGAAAKGEGSLASPPAPSWLHHDGGRFLSPAGPGPAVGAGYLDIFGPLPPRQ